MLFRSWIVDGASPALRVELAALARVVVEEAARALEKPVPESRYETTAHGVLPPRDRAAIQRAALGEVVGPCLRAVFGADADEQRAYA